MIAKNMKNSFLILLFYCGAYISAPIAQTTAATVTTKQTKKHHAKKNKKTIALKADSIPIMSFDTTVCDFGNIKMGDNPEHVFKFKNTGNKDLNIDIVSACDCTELDWTKSTVPPGGTGFVKAIFHTLRTEPEDRKKLLKKMIDIVLKEQTPKNGYPIVESVTFTTFIVD
jgi:hypothetical protein